MEAREDMGMSWLEMTEQLIDAVNVALEAGDWSQVVGLTTDLYAAALSVGEADLAELVQDLHWIATDALAHPVEVEGVIAP
jgi:hypothetical protein